MQRLLFLPILLLSACGTPQETTQNTPQIVWRNLPEGAVLIVNDITLDGSFGVIDIQPDTFDARWSTISGSRTIERISHKTSSYYFILRESNGDLIFSDDSLGMTGKHYPTGGGSLHVHRVDDSIGIGDTVSSTNVFGYCGADFVRCAGQLVLCPHILDSTYSTHHVSGAVDTSINAINYWFDPSHGGYYAKYTQYSQQSEMGKSYIQTTEQDLIDYIR